MRWPSKAGGYMGHGLDDPWGNEFRSVLADPSHDYDELQHPDFPALSLPDIIRVPSSIQVYGRVLM